MKSCPDCAEQVREGATICPNCGHSFAVMTSLLAFVALIGLVLFILRTADIAPFG